MNLRAVLITFALVSLACPPATAQTADPAGLVAGVSQITAAPGLPGPVHPMSPAWWPIATRDDDATFPSLFVAAREYGAGRVVIVGHDGVVTSTSALDNGAFQMNVINWLDVPGTGQLRYTTGHGEWVTASLLSELADLAAAHGMTLSPLAAPIVTSAWIRAVRAGSAEV